MAGDQEPCGTQKTITSTHTQLPNTRWRSWILFPIFFVTITKERVCETTDTQSNNNTSQLHAETNESTLFCLIDTFVMHQFESKTSGLAAGLGPDWLIYQRMTEIHWKVSIRQVQLL